MAGREKTRLVQLRINDVGEANEVFSNRTTERQIPLVLVPDDRWICSCYMNVPTGPLCVTHRWGKDESPEALSEAGLQCTPAWTRIAYCVTAQACTYKAPVTRCPTKDNVMVDCDLTLVFKIGPQARSVKQFIYTLGARRFDDFLAAAVEEEIRFLIRATKHHQVYELRGGNDIRVVRTLRELNKKFNPFGINFNTAAITDVRFSDELQNTLQATTEFKSKIQSQRKKHKRDTDTIQFDADQQLEKKVKEHARQIQELKAQQTRAVIERERRRTDQISSTEVDRTDRMKNTAKNETRAEASVNVAENEASALAEAILSKARANAETNKITVEQETKSSIYQSEQELKAAEDLCNAIIAEAEAEEKAANVLKVKREFDLRMAKLEVLQSFAERAKIIVGGDKGEALVDAMLSADILGKITVQSQ